MCPPKVCLDVTTCKIHLHGVGCLIYTFLCSVQCWYACCACFAPLIWLSLLLCIFALLPICSCMSLCVVHTSIQWSYGHLIQTYIFPPRTLPFCLITCFFAFSCDSHVSLPPFGIFSLFVFSMLFLSVCFFARSLSCFLYLYIYMLDVWMLGVRVQAPRREQKGQGCKQEDPSP